MSTDDMNPPQPQAVRGGYTLSPFAPKWRRWISTWRGRYSPQARHQVYCVGAPKSGTHSIASIFASHWRAEHEPYWWELRSWYPQRASAEVGGPSSHDLWRRRWFLDLDLESSHALGPLVPQLVAAHPQAKFILPYRDPHAWLDSLIEDQLYGLTEPNYQGWWAVYDAYFGPRESAQWAEEEKLIRAAGLYPLATLLNYWRQHHQSIITAVPQAQLLVLPTTKIKEAGALLADFVGVPLASLDMQHGHSYARLERQGLLSKVDQNYLRSLVSNITAKTFATLRELTPGPLNSP